MTAPRQRSKAEFDVIQDHINAVDGIASEMEKKWGVGRLPLLVPPDLSAKFQSQMRKMNDAVWHGDVYDVEVHAAAMHRAWTALDKCASDSGAAGIDRRAFEFAADDGSVFIICADDQVVNEMARGKTDERQRRVYSMREIEILLRSHCADKAKKFFPGAEVKTLKKASKRPVLRDDDLPETLLL